MPHSVAHHPPDVSPASDGSASSSSAESCSVLYSDPFEPQVYNNPAMLVIDKMLLFVHTSLRVYHPPTGSKAPRTQWNAATEPDLPSFLKNGHYLAVFRTRLHSGWSRLHEVLAIPTLSPAPSHNYTDAALPTHGCVRQVERLGLPSLLHGANKAYDLDEIDDAIRPCAHGTMIAEGPSDARLFQFNGTPYMLFALWECYPDQNIRAGRGKLYASQYLTELHFDANPMQQTYPHQTLVRSIGKSVRLTLPGANRHQKNWIPWVYRNALHFSVFIEPHIVTTLGSQDIAPSCSISVQPTMKYNTSNAVLRSLQGRWGMLSGGTPAIEAQCGAEKHMYLAIIHAKHDRKYANFAVGFSQEFPFPVLHVSRMLPLSCKPRAQGAYGFNGSMPHTRLCFPTGLQLVERRLLISYGAGDAESRLWTIEWSTFCSEYMLRPDREHLLMDDLHGFFTRGAVWTRLSAPS